MKEDYKSVSELCEEKNLKPNAIDADLEKRFSYHKPNGEKQEIYPLIREKAKEFAYLIKKYVPESRELALALTKVEESVMWANAGLSRN